MGSFIIDINSILDQVIFTPYITNDEKTSLIYEMEMLKAFATDLEVNKDYWIDLYAPVETDGTTSSISISNKVLLSSHQQDYFGNNLLMTIPVPPKKVKTGCKINNGNVLRSAVVGGLWGMVAGGIAVGAAGTVVIPVIGTITGAVNGAVYGFASGFAIGFTQGVIAEAMGSCGH